MEAELVASGRFVRIETHGARSGEARTVTVGYADDDLPDSSTPGAILVAAGGPDTAWAANLLADPRCRVQVGGRGFDAVAEPLDPAATRIAPSGSSTNPTLTPRDCPDRRPRIDRRANRPPRTSSSSIERSSVT